MGTIFLNALKISALSAAGILVILAVSPLFGKTRTVFWRYFLWIALALRLIFPFDLSIPNQAFVLSFPDGKTEEDKNFSLDIRMVRGSRNKKLSNRKFKTKRFADGFFFGNGEGTFRKRDGRSCALVCFRIMGGWRRDVFFVADCVLRGFLPPNEKDAVFFRGKGTFCISFQRGFVSCAYGDFKAENTASCKRI